MHMQSLEDRWQPIIAESGQLRTSGLTQLNGFLEQVGLNTRYLIHPEEIIADNFAALVTDQDVESPELLTRLEATIQKYANPKQ